MSRWTNDVYHAANHRVKFVNMERVSVPFFAEPGYNCLIESFTPGDPSITIKYDPITYGEFIVERLKIFPEYQF